MIRVGTYIQTLLVSNFYSILHWLRNPIKFLYFTNSNEAKAEDTAVLSRVILLVYHLTGYKLWR